jgi:phospholipid transport system substrate-binding protein
MTPTCLLRGVALFFFFSVIPVSSVAGEATEQIKETTDKIIAILSNPALKAPDKTSEKIRMLRNAVDERFDWAEMSRRTLARHWAKRNDKEKKEFIELFGKLLERTYMDKVGDYAGERAIYKDEKIDGDYGVVDIIVVGHEDRKIPVMYRVKKKGKDWYIYDVSVEGVSLINNYRTQFNSIILSSSYEGLIEKIKTKIAEN